MKRKYFLPVLVLCLFIAACKKESAKKEYCRITKLIKDGNQEIDIKFGDNEKISSIENKFTKELSTYKYSGDEVSITVTKNGSFEYKLIVTNNDDHFATNVLLEATQSGDEWFNQAFSYEGHKVVSINATNSNDESETANYIWENGNPSVLVNAGSVANFEYYTDKNFQDGDWRAVQQLLTGYRIYEYKNLLKSMDISNKKTYYTYNFDEAGRISEATGTSTNGIVTYKIEYDCK